MRISYMLTWALLLLFVTSCTHDELCYHHPHDAKVKFDVDWSKFVEEVPTGMTVTVFPQEGGLNEVVTTQTNTISYALFSLPVGRYHSFVYNQSPSEYGSLSFRGMDKFETAEVYANPRESHWYENRGDEGSRVVTEPEWFAADCLENLVITEAMVEQTAKDYLPQLLQSRSRADNSILVGEYTPLNLVYTITVKVHIEGIYNLRSARASLSGLAEGYYLGQGKPTSNKVTQLMEDWQLTIDSTDPTKGTIVAKITCFGLPYGHQGTAEENELVLSLLLVDNKTVKDFVFPVGDDFEANIEEDIQLQQNLALHLELEITDPLPDVKPEGDSGGGGFDAVVDDWGEEENVDIEM